jgi:hypothetical protein
MQNVIVSKETFEKSSLITHWLSPNASAGQNQFGAATNKSWLVAEQRRINENGGSCVIVTAAEDGEQALARA